MKVLTRDRAHGDYSYDFVEFITRNKVNGELVRCKSKPIVFVGTTSGVFDGHFLPWLLRDKQTHYVLVREAEFENVAATIDAAKLTDFLVPVVYGAAYEDLADFVSTLPQRVVE